MATKKNQRKSAPTKQLEKKAPRAKRYQVETDNVQHANALREYRDHLKQTGAVFNLRTAGAAFTLPKGLEKDPSEDKICNDLGKGALHTLISEIREKTYRVRMMAGEVAENIGKKIGDHMVEGIANPAFESNGPLEEELRAAIEHLDHTVNNLGHLNKLQEERL